jgi:hypothetical protein
MPATPLRLILRSRSTQVRARVKFLLSTYQQPTGARLAGDGRYLPMRLMCAPAPAAGHAAVCLGGVVGGSFIPEV